MHPEFIASKKSINLRGKAIPGAGDRQKLIPGFDQDVFSSKHVLCIGAGGIVSMIAPTLVRKGICRITTETQPLSLVSGGLRAAGELRAGDRIHTWDGNKRREVNVQSVTPTGKEAQVFNLILGEPVLFVAGGFLARSKPPATAETVRP